MPSSGGHLEYHWGLVPVVAGDATGPGVPPGSGSLSSKLHKILLWGWGIDQPFLIPDHVPLRALQFFLCPAFQWATWQSRPQYSTIPQPEQDFREVPLGALAAQCPHVPRASLELVGEFELEALA